MVVGNEVNSCRRGFGAVMVCRGRIVLLRRNTLVSEGSRKG